MAAALLAVVVGFALFGAGPAHAQGGDHGHVDVAVILEVPDSSGVPARDLDIIVNEQWVPGPLMTWKSWWT